MTKTLHPLLSQCSSTKWGKEEGALIRGWKGAHLKGALIWSGGGRKFEDLRGAISLQHHEPAVLAHAGSEKIAGRQRV